MLATPAVGSGAQSGWIASLILMTQPHRSRTTKQSPKIVTLREAPRAGKLARERQVFEKGEEGKKRNVLQTFFLLISFDFKRPFLQRNREYQDINLPNNIV